MLVFLSKKTQPKATPMSIKDHINSVLAKARKFQLDLLNSFPKRKEALLQLVESLASMLRPSSFCVFEPVEKRVCYRPNRTC